ncbi:recombinase family protein [Roseiconus nitratireducens]|uniref:Recombinase family protein n=1 Tax=Roseiconus nitratireducens TaxID=2605748 RepID=A0A5M6D1U6_9BACT|nr:recombinase family protein [Roseiconus nitratireducens]KAA5541487.1 recombinase family protein [Roseiconus nitratireducens]
MIAPNKTSTPTTRCAIYTRKSTEEGLDQEFNSLDAQRAASESFIQSQREEGWVINAERYDDGGFSGGNMDRPAFKRLIEDIEAGKIDCVVVYKVDRLSRSLLDFSRVMETFDKYGVSFVSVTQQFNTTHSMGRLTLNILLSFAQFEREIIGERIRDKIAANCRRGQWTGGYPILGYDVDRTERTPKLIINAQEAARVRQIFTLYLELKSLTAVCDELHRLGWKNKSWMTKKGDVKGGREFDAGSLHALLRHPLYIGRIKHKNETYAGRHEAIVDAAIFDRVQTQLRANNNNRGNRLPSKSGGLLKGLLRCPQCNMAMVHNVNRRGSRSYRYYTCCGALKRGRKSCQHPNLPAAEIEAAVVQQIHCISRDDGLRAEIVRQSEEAVRLQRKEFDTQHQQLTRQLTRDHAEVQRLSTSESINSITTLRLAELHERVERSERQLRTVKARLNEIDEGRLDASEIAAAMGNFDRVWTALTIREQAELLQLLIARVEFDQTDCTIAISFHASGIKTLEELQTEPEAID